LSSLFPNLSQYRVEIIPAQEALPDVIFFQFLEDRRTVQLIQPERNIERPLKRAHFPVDRCRLCTFRKSLELVFLNQRKGYIDNPSPLEE
jgi:hypothetical protein